MACVAGESDLGQHGYTQARAARAARAHGAVWVKAARAHSAVLAKAKTFNLLASDMDS